MKSRNRRMLCLAVALTMSHVAITGYSKPGHDQDVLAQSQLTVTSAEEVAGGQAIDWVVCAVAGIGATFFPFMNLVAGPACFSAVVRTWG